MGIPLYFLTLPLLFGELQGPGITLAELSQGLLDAEASLKSASVTCDYKVTLWSPQKGQLTPVLAHGVCTFDALGRGRYQGFGDMRDVNDLKSYRYRTKAIFDGKRMKVLEGDNTRYLHGKVSEISQLPWPVDPRDYLYRYRSKPVGKLLAEEGSQIVGQVLWNGRRVVEAETKTKVAPNGDRAKNRFLIDCERGFVVVRCSTRIFRPATKDWFDYGWIEGRNYTEVNPGIWVPMEVTQEMYGRSATILSPPRIGRYEIRNTNWVLDAELPDSTFQLDFPPGIIVKDEQTGKEYQTVEMHEGEIVRQVGEGIAIYQEKKSWLSWRTGLLWGGLGALGVGALVAWVVVPRKKKAAVP